MRAMTNTNATAAETQLATVATLDELRAELEYKSQRNVNLNIEVRVRDEAIANLQQQVAEAHGRIADLTSQLEEAQAQGAETVVGEVVPSHAPDAAERASD